MLCCVVEWESTARQGQEMQRSEVGAQVLLGGGAAHRSTISVCVNWCVEWWCVVGWIGVHVCVHARWWCVVVHAWLWCTAVVVVACTIWGRGPELIFSLLLLVIISYY